MPRPAIWRSIGTGILGAITSAARRRDCLELGDQLRRDAAVRAAPAPRRRPASPPRASSRQQNSPAADLPRQRPASRLEPHRCHGIPAAVWRLSCREALVEARRGRRRGRGPRKREVERARTASSQAPRLALAADQRMLEQREQRDRRKSPRPPRRAPSSKVPAAFADSGLPALSSASMPQRAR